MSITFRQIDAFRAVMLTGTTTEAAKMLSVSQPAISRLLADLENEIGYELFGREGRRLAPTAEAELLVEEIQKALVGLEQIKQAAIEIGKGRYARLHLVSVPLAASGIAADLIAEFAQLNPATAITLEVMSSDAALEWVLSQQCDLGITSADVKSPAIASMALGRSSAVCILPRGHALAIAAEITPDMLHGESFVSYCRDSSFRRQLDAIFDDAKASMQRSYEARTTDAVCALVAAGLGVAVIGPIAHGMDQIPGQEGKLHIKPFSTAPEVVLSLIWPTHRPLSAAAKAFMQMAGPAR